MSRGGTYLAGILTGQASLVGMWVAAILLTRRTRGRLPV